MPYPYIIKISSLRDFLRKIPIIGVPEKLTLKVLESLGYKSKNDRPIIPILKFINFLERNGTPNENYVNFRSKEKSKSVMANCIRSAYAELFKMYPDAYRKDAETLRDFFSTQVTAGEKVLSLTVSTFKALCEFADFEALPVTVEKGKEMEVKEVIEKAVPELVINLNIQLALPATEDASVYDKIFQSLKKHLLIRG